MKSLFLLLLLLIPFNLPAQEHLEVRFLDVGQADAVLVRSQGEVMLYDAGARGTEVVTRLMALGIDTVDVLVASHPHADHIGGMSAVVDSLTVLNYTSPGVTHSTVTFQDLVTSLDGKKVLTNRPDSLGDAALLWMAPPKDSTHWSLNERSLGVTVKIGEGYVTLAGDAEEATWDYWLAKDSVFPSQIHKSSHHGSRNGDTDDAINIISPEIVVIQVGQDNRYGHPHREAQELYIYGEAKATVYRTDLDGEVIFELQPDGNYRMWRELKHLTFMRDPE